MFAYSARKNSAKRMPLYSVWKPPVSSCSASGMSNGARLVSARPPMKKMHERQRLHEHEPDVLAVLRVARCSTMLSEPAIRMTLTSVSVTATS